MQVKISSLVFLYYLLPGLALAGDTDASSALSSPKEIACITLSSALVTNANCNQSNGSISLVHDGTAPFTYTWSHDATLNDSIATGLASGLYDVTITDAAGCNADTTLTVANLAGPSGSLFSQDNARCFGSRDGTATISVDDPLITVSWNSNPQQTGLTLSGVSAGVYTATLTDPSGCTASISVVIGQPGPMQLSGSVTPDTCNAGNGTAVVNVLSGGQAPFTYQWDNDATDPTAQRATGFSPGNHQVVVTDVNGCTGTLPVVVPFTQNLFSGQVTPTDPACFGETSGSALATGSGGNGVYTYTWSAPITATGSSAPDLAPGTYSVTITDAEGSACTTTQSFTINEPGGIKIAFEVDKTTTCRSSDGGATAVPTGGTPPYSYEWQTNPLQTGATIANLPPDIYFVVVTDANGCEATEKMVIGSQPGPTFTVDVVQKDDCGLGQGIARINLTQGVAPYEVQWWTLPEQPDSNSFLAYNLTQGVFRAVVMDADSCIELKVFEVTGNTPLRVASEATEPEYCRLADGTAQVVFEGGTPPYSYEWTTSPVQTTQTATGLIPGPYEVTVKDDLNCTLSHTVVVDDTPGFTLAVETDDVDCYEENNGVAVALVAGGRPPFSYFWEPGTLANADIIEGLTPGGYNVTVRDSEGCERRSFGVVSAPDPLEAAFDFQPDTLTPIVLSSSGFEFTNRSEGAEEYLWDFGDGTISADFSPFHAYTAPGEYYVSLFVSNNNRLCTDVVVHGPFVVIEDATLFVPDAFTPNGDGFNDLFEIKGEFVENYQLQIFDRWGGEVFSTNSLSSFWDGQLTSGGSAPTGVYMYHVTGIAAGDKKIDQAGSITLIR